MNILGKYGGWGGGGVGELTRSPHHPSSESAHVYIIHILTFNPGPAEPG